MTDSQEEKHHEKAGLKVKLPDDRIVKLTPEELDMLNSFILCRVAKRLLGLSIPGLTC